MLLAALMTFELRALIGTEHMVDRQRSAGAILTKQWPTETGYRTRSSLLLAGGVGGFRFEVVYFDPNLIVLFFLLGFCLLYTLILIVDALAGTNRTTENQESDWR
jgi:hypothetical protein